MRTKKKLIIGVLGLWLLTGNGLAQQETYNWHFGIHEAYDFGVTSGQIATQTSNDQTLVASPSRSSIAIWNGGSGSISDANGNLLFYTDAQTLWGANHQPLTGGLNGTGLAGSILNMGVPIAKQPALPTNNTDQDYMVFTVSPTHQLRYTEVRHTFFGNTLSVIDKNVPIAKSIQMSQKLAITNAENCTDVWVVVHDFGTKFYAYRITDNGISLAVISDFPTVNIAPNSGVNMGCMKISPDGSLLAMNYWVAGGSHCTLFKFDNTTGEVLPIDAIANLPYTLDLTSSDPGFPETPVANNFSSTSNYFGAEFSPNSKVLYISIYSVDGEQSLNFFQDNCGGTSEWGCIQLDVSVLNSTTINNSRRIAARQSMGMLQLGPDGRIYAARHEDYLLGSITTSAIEKPNEMNTTMCSNECQYTQYVAVPGSTIPGPAFSCGEGLPLFNSSYFNNITPLTASAYPSSYCQGTPLFVTLTVSGLPGTIFEWRAGSCSSPIIGTSNPLTIPPPITTTTYYVRAINSCGYATTCTPVTITVYQPPKTTPPIQGNTSICLGESTTLFVTPTNGQTYNWYDDSGEMIGSNVTSITVSPSVTTTYELQAVSSNGCPGTPVQVTVTVNPIPEIGYLNEAITCGECVTLGPTQVSPDYTYQWSPSDDLDFPNDPNPVFCPPNPFSSTEFSVVVTDVNTGCTLTAYQNVWGAVFSYDAGPGGALSDPDCVTQSSALFGTPIASPFTYTVTPNTYITQMNTDGTFVVTHPDNLTTAEEITYTITVYSEGGLCYVTDEIVISFTDDDCGFKSSQFFENSERTGEVSFSKMTIAPNPSNGEFTLYPNNTDEINYIVIITDLTGKMVYTSSHTGDQPVRINLLDQQRGMYLVTVRYDNVIETQKLILE